MTASESMPSATSASIPVARRQVERRDDPPVKVDPLADLVAQVALDQRDGLLPGHVVQPRHAQPAQLEDITKARGGQRPGPAPLRSRIALVATVLPWTVADPGRVDVVEAEHRPDALRHPG